MYGRVADDIAVDIADDTVIDNIDNSIYHRMVYDITDNIYAKYLNKLLSQYSRQYI